MAKITTVAEGLLQKLGKLAVGPNQSVERSMVSGCLFNAGNPKPVVIDDEHEADPLDGVFDHIKRFEIASVSFKVVGDTLFVTPRAAQKE